MKKLGHIKVLNPFIGSNEPPNSVSLVRCSIASSFSLPLKESASTVDISERSTEKSNSGSVMHIGDAEKVGSGANLFFIECFASNFFIAAGSESAHSLSSLHKSSSSTI